MPSIMAANIGVWTNPHPLGLAHKEPPTTMTALGGGWNHVESSGEKKEDSVNGSVFSRSSLLASRPPPTRRPPTIRSDSQKVIEVRNRIFVGGLTEAINEDDLRGLFGKYGQINEVAIKARGGDQFRGFGFVTFSRNSEAADCLRESTGEVHTLRGRKVNVQAAFKRVDKVNVVGPTQPGVVGGWIGAAPTPLPNMAPPVTFNPYYLGPPILAPNGMWFVGPASGCGGGGGGFPVGMMPPGMGGGFFAPPLPQMEPDVMSHASLMGHDVIGGPSASQCVGGKIGDRIGGFESGYQPIGMKNSSTESHTGGGSCFTTQSLSAPWFLPN